MDEVDFHLLARLVREPLASMASLARDVDLTPNAVRARFARLREHGVLAGTVALPNARLFGRVTKLAVYLPPAKSVPLTSVVAIDDVLGASTNHDGQVAVTYYARSADEAPPSALDRLMGAPAPRVLVREDPELSPKGAVLSAQDWRLVEAILEDARQTHRALASATGLGERAVARHYEKLVAGRFVWVVPVVLPNVAEGIVPYHLWVHGAGTMDEAAVRAAIGSAEVEERLVEPRGLFLFCRAQTLGDALSARDRVAKLPGIDHVEIVLQERSEVAWPRIRRLCQEARARTAARAQR